MTDIDDAPSGPVPCAWCARPVDARRDATALFVQLRRGADDLGDWSRFLDLPFCGEDHARQWFAGRPVPPEADWQVEDDDEEDQTLREKVGFAAAAVVVIGLLVGSANGLWQLVTG